MKRFILFACSPICCRQRVRKNCLKQNCFCSRLQLRKRSVREKNVVSVYRKSNQDKETGNMKEVLKKEKNIGSLDSDMVKD